MAVFYRFQESHFSEYGLMLVHYEFPVIKHTRCGVWLDVFCTKRFVLLTSRKRFACATETEAFESYQARKRRQVKILETQLRRARAALRLQHTGNIEYFD